MRRPAPRWLLARRAWLLAFALGAASLLALPGLAFHSGAGADCPRIWECDFNLRPAEARSADTWVDETHPDANYDSGDGSQNLVIGAPPPDSQHAGQRQWTLLRFPLEDLPRNITIQRVVIQFGLVSSSGGRTVHVYEMRTPWDEGTINWTQAQDHVGFQFNPVPVMNVSSPTSATPCFGGSSPAGQPQWACYDGGTVPVGDPPDGLDASFIKYYLGQAPYYGHLFRDEDASTASLPVSQKYYSSSDLNIPAAGAVDRRPTLIVQYDPNAPQIHDLLEDGQRSVNATSTRPVNLTFEVFDKLGSVTNAWINATDEQGREVFNRSVFQNRSTMRFDVLHHTVWSNASLDLPGECNDAQGNPLHYCRYIVNAFALDDDGNLNYTKYNLGTGLNLTVENQPPYVNDSRVDTAELDQGDAFHADVNATDTLSGIAAVSLQVERAGLTLENLSFSPVQGRVDRNASGLWHLDAVADFAGRVNLTIWVQDRAGNLNHSLSFALHVRDTLPPVFQDATVIAPGQTSEGAVQESGGTVGWEAHVTDASAITVTLLLDPPGGAAEQAWPLTQRADGTWAYSSAFDVVGSYGARLVAVDADGNTALRTGLGFVLQAPAPPVIDTLQPAPGGWAPGQVLISAVVSDLNLDPGTLTMEVRVQPDAFVRVEAHGRSLGGTAQVLEYADTFFHGEQVEVRVRGADSFQRFAERSWNFTVDARLPLTVLTPEGPFLAGNRTGITGNTSLRLDRSDEGSGVLATVVALVNEDLHLETGNITITGSAPARITLATSPVYAGTGNYTVFYASVDAAGNVEKVNTRKLLVDDTPPTVSVSFEPGLLTARVHEVGTGVKEVRAHYAIAPSGQQGDTLLSPTSDPEVWQGQIPDSERGSRVVYSVTATDRMGNVGQAGSAGQPLSSVVQNHAPVVALSPPNGSLARGLIRVTWDVTDRDGDPVQVDVQVRPSTSDTPRDLAPNRGASGGTDWDTTEVGDGLWEIIVNARDAFTTTRASTFVDVSNTDTKIVRLQAPGGEPGQASVIAVTLYKPVRQAEAVLTLDGEEVARVPLRDDGGPPDAAANDGVFTGAFFPAKEGTYRMELDVLFTDGRSEQRSDVPVSVQYAYPARIVHDPLLLGLAIGVPAVLVGAFLYRRYGPIKVQGKR